MLIDERKNQILMLVKEKRYVSVNDLCKLVYASSATIRRDLAFLSNAGLIQRVRGGASVLGNSTGETAAIVRAQANIFEKKRIANAAFRFLHNGQSYFFDGSTTVGELVPLLSKLQNITVITNGCENAVRLADIATCQSYIAGGKISLKSASSTGSDTLSSLENFSCDATFFSCRGFSLTAGPSEGTIEQQRAKAAMLRHSTKHVLLVDHTKFDQTYVGSVCSLAAINILITDEKPREEYTKFFERNGIQLIVAE